MENLIHVINVLAIKGKHVVLAGLMLFLGNLASRGLNASEDVGFFGDNYPFSIIKETEEVKR